MSFASFDGLQNTVKMNEYMLSLEQDIRAIQRSAMLLERDPDEAWLYGLGIDFSEAGEEGEYKIFKWCSEFADYGDKKTKSELPAYDSGEAIGGSTLRNAWLPGDRTTGTESKCIVSGILENKLVTLSGYEVSLNPPKAEISTYNSSLDRNINYIVFESISGRAFFYDEDGELINYTDGAELSDNVYDFELTVNPVGVGKTRNIAIGNLSGKITLSFVEDVED